MSIEIPLKSTNEDEVIEIQLNNLPEVDEILSVLENERSQLNIWSTLATHYYRQGRSDDLMAILKKATEPGKESDYEGTNMERIACLNALAAYYCMKAEREKDKRVAEELLQNAVSNFNRSDNINLKDVSTWLGKGVLHLLKGDFERASYHFKYASSSSEKKNEQNIPAILGQADLCYAKKRYQDALSLYKQALTLNPDCPAEVRLGIGQCFFKLGNYEKARLAFERTRALNEKSVGALVGLAILELNSESPDGLIKGMRLLTTAYGLDSTSSMILNHLANHFFFKGHLDKVHNLALIAFHNTNSDEIKAESCYIIGRTYQRQELYDQAFQFYFQASKFNPELLPAQYGLGQMYIFKSQLKQAAECFEKVDKSLKGNYETLRILGTIYIQQGKEEKAREYLKQVVTMRPSDIEAWIEYGSLLEAVDPAAARDAYLKVKTLLTDEAKTDVPPELWNNIGCLSQNLGDMHMAHEAYQSALSSMETETDEEIKKYNESIAITIRYNIARWHEVAGDLQKAQGLYEEILRDHPSYVDCHMRLGIMRRNCGQIVDAATKYKDALFHNTNHLGVRTLMGNLHMGKGEIVPAQKIFDGILRMSKHDSYCQIALGNIWHLSATPDKKEKMETYWDRALQFYSKALRTDPKNLYAANGIGVVLAEKHHPSEARDIFVQVREATSEMADVWINLAHVYCEQGQYVNAINMYQNCLRKFHQNHDTTILTYLARAHYKLEKYHECKQILQKAYHINPQDQDISYNLALAQQMICVSTLRATLPTSAELQSAIKDIKQAQRIFRHLAANRDPRSKFSSNQCERDVRHCKDLLIQAEHVFEKTRREEDKTHTRLAKFNKERKAREDKLQALKDEKQRQLMKEAEELRMRREQDMKYQEAAGLELREEHLRGQQRKARAQERKDRPGSDDDERPKKSKKSKKPRADYDDNDGMFGSDSEPENSPKRARSDSESDVESNERLKKKAKADDDSLKKQKISRAGGRHVVSKSFISDSDEELAEENNPLDDEPLSPVREAQDAHSDNNLSD